MSTLLDSTLADYEWLTADLQRQLAECRAERDEALAQQTATAEVLWVINASPGNLAPVFDAMLEKALRLCEVDIGTLWIYDGKMVHAAAVRGAPPQLTEFLAKGPHLPARPQLRVLSGAEPLMQIPDITETEAYRDGDPIPRAIADLGGVRTLLIVPLRKDDAVLGNFAIYRREPRPFTDKQIALLQNFAAQAVIAMENARLLTETREALEQQTATAEVLQVINSSPGELRPVFDAMLEKAMHLCEAAFGMLWTYEGDRYHAAAVQGAPPAFVEFVRQPQLPPYHPESGLGRMLQGQDLAMHEDMSSEEAYRTGDPLAPGDRRSWWCPQRGDGFIAQGRNLAGCIYRLPPGSPAVLRQADRAAAKLRGASGHSDGQCAAVGRDPPASGRAARHLRQYGRRSGDVRR